MGANQKQPKIKHVPMRTCIASGEKKPKKDLIRLVRVDDDATAPVKVDLTGKLRGRGANITPTNESLELAIKKGAIERALKFDHKMSAEMLAQLRQDFADAIFEKEFRQGRKPVVLKVKKAEFDAKMTA